MNNSDLEVAKLLNEYKTKAYGSLEKGVYIKERFFEFEYQYYYNKEFCIMIPKEFIDMPEEIKTIKYISENRPKIIKMIPEAGIDIGFSRLPVNLTNNQLPQIFQQSKNAIKKLNPAIVLMDEGQTEEKNKLLLWLDYISPALDGQMYCVMFLTNLGEYTYHGIFNCAVSEMEAWKEVVKNILGTIQLGV